MLGIFFGGRGRGGMARWHGHAVTHARAGAAPFPYALRSDVGGVV